MKESDNLFDKHLNVQGKLDYVKGVKRPKVPCIFCSIINNEEEVVSLTIYQDDIVLVCLNLYPYNPGHLIVLPIRHIEDFRELEDKEIIHLSNTIKKCQNMLDDLFHPTGYNIGLNIGENSGASIKHLHYHIVPRYRSELGFIDIIGKTKIVVENVSEILKKMENVKKKYFD